MDRPFDVQPLEVGLHRFSPEEVERFRRAGYGRVPEPGVKPALLVVDVTYEFCGPDRRRSADSPKSSGEAAWDAIDRLQDLLPAARLHSIPVIYTRNMARRHPVEQGAWRWKAGPQGTGTELDIVEEVAPEDGDLVIEKTKPSAFFSTPLASYLIDLGCDTLLVAGATTSGCVRATVTDAFSHNFRTFVVADCVFDRSPTSHEVSLFDMQQKYAGLVLSEGLLKWMGG